MGFVSMFEDMRTRYFEAIASTENTIAQIKNKIDPFLLKELMGNIDSLKQVKSYIDGILDEITKPQDESTMSIQNFILRNDINGMKAYFSNLLKAERNKHDKQIVDLRKIIVEKETELKDKGKKIVDIKQELKQSKILNEKSNRLHLVLCDSCKKKLYNI